MIVRVAADLGLFRLLADKKDGSLSLEDLSKETGAAPALLSMSTLFDDELVIMPYSCVLNHASKAGFSVLWPQLT